MSSTFLRLAGWSRAPAPGAGAAPLLGGQPARVGFISLGCPKNLVDTEVMLGMLRRAGYQITANQHDADVLVVNTCSFIGSAKEESIRAILEAGEEKKRGRCKAVVVTGCLPQRYKAELMAELPEVDALVGTADYTGIAQVIQGVLGGERIDAVTDPDDISDWNFERLLATPGHTAYLKIAEGCNCACSFCIIPQLRGHHRSRPLESILEEARRLADLGVKELVVVSQDTTYYGVDRYGQPRLAELLNRLARIDGIRWLRLQYSYPTRVNDALIEALAGEEKVCKYLDMPLQHGSDRMLKAMNRGGSRRFNLALVERLKARVPRISLRTSLIAGHPGESDADFAQLLSFIREIEFDHVGVFAYSQEEGTPAGARPDQVPEAERERRRHQAMLAQQPIAVAKNRTQIGRRLEVLVEGKSELSGQVYYGRSYREAPGIDGQVYFADEGDTGPLAVGDLVAVAITGVQGYDLVGRLVL